MQLKQCCDLSCIDTAALSLQTVSRLIMSPYHFTLVKKSSYKKRGLSPNFKRMYYIC